MNDTHTLTILRTTLLRSKVSEENSIIMHVHVHVHTCTEYFVNVDLTQYS
jgi:hypothetical protein